MFVPKIDDEVPAPLAVADVDRVVSERLGRHE